LATANRSNLLRRHRQGWHITAAYQGILIER
jgi:hypothetical protein